MATDMNSINEQKTLDLPQGAPNAEHERCCELAWRALCNGIYTHRGIARYVNGITGCSHDHKWVKRAIEKYSKLVDSFVANGAVKARSVYLQGLHEDLSSLALIAGNNSLPPDTRIRARCEITKIRKLIAAALGVVTDRSAHELSGNDGAPVQITIAPFEGEDGTAGEADSHSG